MKVKITIPTKQGDISLSQFQEFAKISDNNDDIFRLSFVVKIMNSKYIFLIVIIISLKIVDGIYIVSLLL